MKPPLTLLLFCAAVSLHAQTFEKKVKPFVKVIASPKINLVLVEGANESVKINYANVDPSKINVTVNNNTLRIYLESSRITEKRKRVRFDGEVRIEKLYRDAIVTAYVS